MHLSIACHRVPLPGRWWGFDQGGGQIYPTSPPRGQTKWSNSPTLYTRRSQCRLASVNMPHPRAKWSGQVPRSPGGGGGGYPGLAIWIEMNFLYLRIPQQGRTLIEGVSIERLYIKENSCARSDTIGYMCTYYLKAKKRQRRVVCESFFLLWYIYMIGSRSLEHRKMIYCSRVIVCCAGVSSIEELIYKKKKDSL